MLKADERPKAGGLTGWLDTLQRESWQLELLISGFAIFLLIGGWGPLNSATVYLDMLTDESGSYNSLYIAYEISRVAYLALIVLLIVHVLLRGMWVAAIGLRSVSGDIDYDHLRYQPGFRQWLGKSVGSFDRYVERLERYSSVLFAVAFLVIFCFLSLLSYLLTIIALKALLNWIFGTPSTQFGVFTGGWIDLVMLVLGVVYLLDFATLGLLKRSRWTARVYYPIYRFMGWITLARLYRPLYHNLIDNRFGRRIAWALPFLVVVFIMGAGLKIVTSPHFPYFFRDGKALIDHYNYDDYQPDLLHQRWRVTLNSKYVRNNYVEVFVPYRAKGDDVVIGRVYPDLQPGRYAGLKLTGGIAVGQSFNQGASNDSLLLALSTTARLFVDDSLRTDVQPRAHYHPAREQAGLLYMVPAHDLAIGEHTVRVDRRRVRNDSLEWHERGIIYFYK